jgi:hypothetical protein
VAQVRSLMRTFWPLARDTRAQNSFQIELPTASTLQRAALGASRLLAEARGIRSIGAQMPPAPSERARAAAMPPSRERRATAGRPAARLGEDDSWGMAAARSWSSVAAVEAAASSSDAGPLPPSGFDHAELSEEEPDEPPPGAAGRELPALGSRLRVWWPRHAQWFEGKVDKIVVQDGGSIQRVRYDDNDVRWYDWSGPKAPLFEILYIALMLGLMRHRTLFQNQKLRVRTPARPPYTVPPFALATTLRLHRN